jgi:hypothetical protein
MNRQRIRNSLGPIIGYHGCDRAIAERVLTNKTQLKPSENDYDWLGPGIYFWVDSFERGMEWAIEQKKRERIQDPYVIGAYIHPGLCLNLTDYGVMDELQFAYKQLRDISSLLHIKLPRNKPMDGFLLLRHLDCAVINMIHILRRKKRKPSYDTVYGVFEEGKPVYRGAGFKEKTHIQIAVRNPKSIFGYFRVPGL